MLLLQWGDDEYLPPAPPRLANDSTFVLYDDSKGVVTRHELLTPKAGYRWSRRSTSLRREEAIVAGE